MNTTVDARGLPCPQPVLLTRQALAKLTGEGVITVLLDDQAARENVSRFATSQECTVQTREVGSGEWEITLTQGYTCDLPTPAASLSEKSDHDGARGVVVYINSATVGRGDDELGRILMHAFMGTWKEVAPLPTHLIFANGGVRLTTAGSEVADDLQELATRGVEILSCGTCLDFFDLKEKLVVGRMSNTFEIAGILLGADNVVTP